MGKAIPSLISGDPSEIQEHVLEALNVKHTANLINEALAPEVRRVVHTCTAAPERVVAHRTNAIRYLLEVAAKLEPARVAWRDSLPPNAPGRHLHLPLIHFLAKSLNLPVELFAKDLAAGMPIIGAFPPTPTPNFHSRACGASLTFEQWKRDIPCGTET